MEQNQNTSLFSLNLDAQNSYTLRSSAVWAKVLGIVGILLGILFIIIAIMAGVQSSNTGYRTNDSFNQIFGSSRSAAAGVGITLMVITGLVFIIGAAFSLSFGNKINTALKANDQAGVNSAFAALRNYYAFRSIILIIVLLLFLISFASSL